MPCFNPVQAYALAGGGVCFSQLARHGDITAPVSLPCGQCLGCRLERARAWSLRIMHEASLSRDNCFVTLTYSDEHLPRDNSLNYAHFQLFIRRLRKHVYPRKVRFYMCGEYGDQTERAHFHACLFNVHFRDQTHHRQSEAGTWCYSSPTLDKLWPFGQATVGDLTPQSAGYTARYILQKRTGDLGAAHYGARVPPFNRMSLKPGIGARWFSLYSADLFTGDYAVNKLGNKHGVPRYYDKLFERSGGDLDQVKADRALRSLPFRSECTPGRLATRLQVQAARVRTLKRSLT